MKIPAKIFIIIILVLIISAGLIYLSYSSGRLNTHLSIPKKQLTPEQLKQTIDNIDDYCTKIYEETDKCPEDLCHIGCVGGGADLGCAIGCTIKGCGQFDSEACPTSHCRVLKNCENNLYCTFIPFSEEPECGKEGYYGPKECCDGLVKRCGYHVPGVQCDKTNGTPLCMACGNGVCEFIENNCSCPEDCKE